jgi:hypothetical protein
MSTLPQGTIVVYPYLWHREYRRGETEGRKSRPVCVTFSFPHPRDGEETLALFALTTKVPGPDDHALEVPELELKQLKMRDRSWIILDECNHDRAQGSIYLNQPPIIVGRLSKAFTQKLVQAIIPYLTASMNIADRTI